MLNAADVGVDVNPDDDAVMVRSVTAVLMVTPLKVARPALSVVDVAPESITPADTASVTLTPGVAAWLPLDSCS
jgi:hypothetical protein